MPKYIDTELALKMKDEERMMWVYDLTDLEEFLASVPSADVVPRAEVDELIGKFECFLCHATGSRLSKHTYDLRTMETVATDCINETYNDGYGEGYRDCAMEIFEEIITTVFSKMPSDVLIVGRNCDFTDGIRMGKREAVIDMINTLAELKKKYTEGKE